MIKREYNEECIEVIFNEVTVSQLISWLRAEHNKFDKVMLITEQMSSLAEMTKSQIDKALTTMRCLCFKDSKEVYSMTHILSYCFRSNTLFIMMKDRPAFHWTYEVRVQKGLLSCNASL